MSQLPGASQQNRVYVEIRIDKESGISLRQQIAAQIEYQIAIGKLKPGDPLPAVKALARQLRIHHNTVSRVYQDVTALNLAGGIRGSRLVVRTPEDRGAPAKPDLDDLINQAIRTARGYGYSLQELSQRVRDRLADQSPDRVLVLSIDPGMQRLLQIEVGGVLRCRVDACSPAELLESPDNVLGALVVSPPGVLPMISLSFRRSGRLLRCTIPRLKRILKSFGH